MVTAERRTHCCELDVSEAVERYLKAIYLLSFRTPSVSATAVADRLGVSGPSVSAMLRRLDGAGLLAGDRAAGIRLNGHGQRHARHVVRRHRLIETFLVRAVGMTWDEVHVEAEALEHAASDLLIERIDAALGHPEHDPHGDPIPPATGRHSESWSPSLAQAPVGSAFEVDRVSDEDSAALRYLAERGIRPGVRLRLLEREPFGGPLWIEIDGQRHGLGPGLVELIHGATAR